MRVGLEGTLRPGGTTRRVRGWLLCLGPWIAEPDGEPSTGTSGRRAAELFRLATRTASLLFVFIVLQRAVGAVFRPSEAAFEHGSILVACLREEAGLVIAGVVMGAYLLVMCPRLRQGWDQFDGGPQLRWFITSLAAMLAWAGSTYAYNSWYDERHLVDRAVLVVLAALVWWRPLFALPLAGAFWAAMWQLNYPPLGFSTLQAEFKPVVNTLTLFSSALFVRSLFPGRRLDGFLFLTLCLVAANYWIPGYEKLRIAWMTHGHVYLLFPDAYAHGWLAYLEPETVASLTRLLTTMDVPMRLAVLCIECAALFLLLNVKVAQGLLALFTILLGAFFMTIGFLFWKWMALQVALWIVLFGTRHPPAAVWRRDLFTTGRFLVSVLVIGGSGLWFTPARLAWFDTPLSNTFRYEAIGVSGAAYDLPSTFFAPYESHIAMAGFVPALTPAPVLTASYGVTKNRKIADALLRARTPDDVVRLEKAFGGDHSHVDTELARLFDEFVRRTVDRHNRTLARGRSSSAISFVRPPPFLWTYARGPHPQPDDPIASVRVYLASSFFDGRDYTLFRHQLLRTVVIQP